MSLGEIKAASKKQLEAERAEADRVSETTPSQIDDKILRFCASLGTTSPLFVPVLEDQHGLFGWCSDGVTEKVKADGGKPIFGWTIWEWPNVLLTAEFHCVWQDNHGYLYDITPKPKQEAQIVFVPDDTYAPDFDFDNRPRNRRCRIYAEADRSADVATIIGSLAGSKRDYEQRRADKAGLPLAQWLLRKLPIDPLPAAIDAVISACNEHEEYFDSFGGAGFVRPDEKLISLIRRRISAQERLKQLL